MSAAVGDRAARQARKLAASERRRRLLLRSIALLLGTGSALLLVELGLRIVGYDGAAERTTRSFDPRYGTVPKDSWIFGFAIDPARHRAVDLRGQRIPLAKPAGETRVLFIGDSATEGAFVGLEHAFPARFEALLHQRNGSPALRAINAGVWGMTTIDEYHLLADKLLPLAPDRVVLGLFMANDINFNLAHDQRVLRVRAPAWIDAARQRSALAHFLFLRALALNARYGFARSERFGREWQRSRVGLVDSYGLHMLSYPAGELALYMKRPSPLADEAFAVLRDVLAQLSALGMRRGFSLVVLLIPSPSTVLGRLAILHHPDILSQLRSQGVHVT
ncbi:MAG TPA: SGNH/GDSL hydrolase family protein, partial [Polyangiales bacterium]|nr:SGNH/GDSL hydrolase family protein [Polyangiales bacterium]